MSKLEILLPFGLPPAEMAPDLLRALKTPALATLLARAKSLHRITSDGFTRALPHETWISGRFGLENDATRGCCPALARAAMQALGLTADSGVWFMLQPVHIHIARDHLVLTDLRQLALADAESRALFETAKPLFDEAGKTLLYGDAHTWFVRADDWVGLQTSTPDAACGHNVDIWMPKGNGERDWRKLQNDVQMHWHIHPVNAAREINRLEPVNSIWLWGAASDAAVGVDCPYTLAATSPDWTRAATLGAPARVGSATELIAAAPKCGLAVLDALIGPALSGDWSAWLAALEAYETDCFAPLLQALQAGNIDHATLILTHHAELNEFALGKHSLRKFWIKPSLKRLMP